MTSDHVTKQLPIQCFHSVTPFPPSYQYLFLQTKKIVYNKADLSLKGLPVFFVFPNRLYNKNKTDILGDK